MNLRFLLTAGLLAIAACDYNSSALSSGPQVSNTPDDFVLQLSEVSNVSDALEYSWQNSGTTATVTQAASDGSFGAATLIIRDGAGAEIYRHDLKQSGTFVSSPAAAAGAWTIRVELGNFYGAVNVHVQKSS